MRMKRFRSIGNGMERAILGCIAVGIEIAWQETDNREHVLVQFIMFCLQLFFRALRQDDE